MSIDWIADVRAVVDGRLRSYFEEKRTEAERISPQAGKLVEAMETLTMRGGKRLRPAVMVAAYRGVAGAGADLGPTANAGAALELLQSYLLTHDDWMDQDDERRGGPSVHAALREELGDAHVAASIAVLAGDLGCTYAWELALAAPWPEGRRRDAEQAFVDLQKEVLFGQQLDLMGHPDVALMHQLKTGSYTVRGPLRLGGLLANASGSQLDALDRFGTPLGEAFQLRDDILGTFGDSKATGKPAGNDLRAGKHNALVAEAERLLGEEARAPLNVVLGNPGASDAQVAEATELLVTCGARKRVEERLEERLSAARAALDGAPFDSAGAQLLHQVADKLAVRSM